MPVLTSRMASSCSVASPRGLGLDHALDLALGVAHHAPVAGGVLELGGQHRRAGAGLLVRVDEPRERLGVDQRDVAEDHHDGVVLGPISRGGRGDGVAGPARLLLDGHVDAVGQVVGEPALRPSSTTIPSRAPASRAAAIGHAISGRPHSGCRTFGREERIRVPSPAARMTTVGAGTGAS